MVNIAALWVPGIPIPHPLSMTYTMQCRSPLASLTWSLLNWLLICSLTWLSATWHTNAKGLSPNCIPDWVPSLFKSHTSPSLLTGLRLKPNVLREVEKMHLFVIRFCYVSQTGTELTLLSQCPTCCAVKFILDWIVAWEYLLLLKAFLIIPSFWSIPWAWETLVPGAASCLFSPQQPHHRPLRKPQSPARGKLSVLRRIYCTD